MGCRPVTKEELKKWQKLLWGDEDSAMDLNNEKRCVAAKIIIELYEAKKSEQLKTLKAGLDQAIRLLEKEGD